MTFISGLLSGSFTSHQGSSLAVPIQTFVKTPDIVLMHILIIKVFPVLIIKSSFVHDTDCHEKITRNHLN